MNYVVQNSTMRMVGSEGNESLIVRGVACVDGVVSFWGEVRGDGTTVIRDYNLDI